MTVKLKKDLGEAGARIDESVEGSNRLLTVLTAITNQLNDLTDQFNQLKADYDGETNAAHVATTATDVVKGVEVE